MSSERLGIQLNSVCSCARRGDRPDSWKQGKKEEEVEEEAKSAGSLLAIYRELIMKKRREEKNWAGKKSRSIKTDKNGIEE